MKRNFCVAACLVLLSIPSFAADMVVLDTFASNGCLLAQPGYGNMKNPLLWKGVGDGSSCEVSLPKKEFSKMFESCALAGMLVYNNMDHCSFSITDDEMQFYAKGGKNMAPHCSFVCIRKSK